MSAVLAGKRGIVSCHRRRVQYTTGHRLAVTAIVTAVTTADGHGVYLHKQLTQT